MQLVKNALHFIVFIIVLPVVIVGASGVVISNMKAVAQDAHMQFAYEGQEGNASSFASDDQGNGSIGEAGEDAALQAMSARRSSAADSSENPEGIRLDARQGDEGYAGDMAMTNRERPVVSGTDSVPLHDYSKEPGAPRLTLVGRDEGD